MIVSTTYYVAVSCFAMLEGLMAYIILLALRRAEGAAKAATVGVYAGQVRWRPDTGTLLIVRQMYWKPA